MKKIIVCFVILIILLAAIIGVPRGENMKQEKIPQAVIDFVGPDCDQTIIFAKNWNNYKVYTFDWSYISQGEVIGLPIYILFDGKNVRWANDEERDELMYLNNN